MNEEKYIYLVFPSVIGLKILNSILFELCSNLNSNYSLSKSSHLILYILLLVLPTQKALSNDKVDYFKDILPIFEQNCLQCHGPDKQKSDLRVDLRNSLIEGGDSGLPAIKPGDWEGSFLMDVVTHKDEDMAMPPKGEKLLEGEINKIMQWVNSGAYWPGQMQEKSQEDIILWSFKPVSKPKVPFKKKPELSSHPIDAFISSEILEKNLIINPPADPRSLIKRTYIIFTGLIPDSKTIEKFVGDYLIDEEAAFKSLVNSLLSSPHFGERWAQHWLDVIRWAETNGSESNLYRKNAWVYRDYVIRSFNNDLPYNQFIREQLVGDQLGSGDATGFLVSGPHVPAATIGQEPSAIRQARSDRMDEIMQTVGASIMGVTVSCARCHNHKFDPISITDYYSMSAVFQGVEFGGRWPEYDHKNPRKIKADAISLNIEKQRNILKNGIGSWEENWGGFTDMYFPTSNVDGLKIDFDWSAVSIDELEIYGPDNEINVALSSSGTTVNSDPAMAVPRGELYKVNDGNYGTQNWRSKSDKSEDKPWLEFRFNKTVRVNKIRFSKNRESYFETDYLENTPNKKFPTFKVSVLLDGSWIELTSSKKIKQKTNKDSNLFNASKSLYKYIDQIKSEGPQHSFVGRFITPPITRVLHRGSPENPKDVVVPAGFNILNGDLGLDSSSPENIRRKAFADWLVSPDHPLTSRVIVNRVWSHLFGKGIVSTTSDFGNAGAKPSHPELLDWLASEFVNPVDTDIKPWSIKDLIRLMATSEAFQRSSAPNEVNTFKDESSTFLWRYPPRRVEAEVIRDSILIASDKIDKKLGGRSYRIHNIKKTYSQWEVVNNFGEPTWRRMIYQERMRRVDDKMFTAFDFPDCGQVRSRRPVSTTPLQALNLLNSDFVIEQSNFIANRAIKEVGNNKENIINRIYQILLGRAPDKDELSYSKTVTPVMLSRTLINSNEFSFLP